MNTGGLDLHWGLGRVRGALAERGVAAAALPGGVDADHPDLADVRAGATSDPDSIRE